MQHGSDSSCNGLYGGSGLPARMPSHCACNQLAKIFDNVKAVICASLKMTEITGFNITNIYWCFIIIYDVAVPEFHDCFY